jgi:crotonobetainyl-CoA:carnitine CoA-transferase CaiB-like acyl-CoA transferase
MTPEDEEFNRVEMESRIKQEYIRSMRKTTREEKISRPAVYEVPTEAVLEMRDYIRVLENLVRELGDRLAKLEKPWVGLTDEDLESLCNEWRIVFGSWTYEFAKAIEAKLKEKNNG